MAILLAIALKSLFVAALTLGLLRWMRGRSAAERSMVAHAGLLALVLIAFAPLAMPRLTIEAPVLFPAAQPASTASSAIDAPVKVAPNVTILPEGSTAAAAPTPAFPPVLVATALYAVPAAILLLLTALAIFRLFALRARADVLVDAHWLSALARAQRRMGFKHGTALLTSNDLNSPVSWGVMRPVILLNDKAVEAAGEAEAIIAHELAHVARLDWMKLLLARIATALFWFNPLVWILSREAHQLREETADDAVLAANIEDTDYAELLVGVARHDCPGLLLGAHGVAPSRKSLSRRIARVLDRSTVRGPAARPFALGVVAGAGMAAAPLAALTFIPMQSAQQTPTDTAKAARSAFVASQPTDLGSLIATGVSTSVASVAAAVAPDTVPVPVVLDVNPQIQIEGRIADTIRDAHEARAIAIADARRDREIAISGDRVAIREKSKWEDRDGREWMTALGVTQQWIDDMRAASPALRGAEASELAGLKAVGANPSYVRELAAAGLGRASIDEIEEARAVGVSSTYARSIIAEGVRADLDNLIEMRALGVTADFIRRMRSAGYRVTDPDDLVELFVVGAEGAGRAVPKPPKVFAPPPLPRGGT